MAPIYESGRRIIYHETPKKDKPMAKYRRKIEHVEAVQMLFGKHGWPVWLDGELSIKDGPAIKEGDYLVRDGAGVAVLSAEDFEDDFESSRAPKHSQIL